MPKMTQKQEKLLELLKKRFHEVVNDYSDERKNMFEDAVFADIDQWPQEIRNSREKDVNGARPVLTIDKIHQYISQIVNDMRQNKPAVKIIPVDDEADVKTAEVFQGLVRRIEDLSDATEKAYLNAGECSVKMGEGYWALEIGYESPTSFKKEIKIVPIYDTFSVYLGHHSDVDGADAEFAFWLEDMPHYEFERRFPKAEYDKQTFESQLSPGDVNNWREEEWIRVALYYYYDYEDKDLLLLEDGSSMLQEEYEEILAEIKASGQPVPVPEIVDTRKTKVRKVKWAKATGVEILEEGEWPGKYIPIIKVTGKQADVKGKKVRRGIIRKAKDSLRAYNYWFSTITEKLALAPKAPFIGAVGQFETHAEKWRQANKINYSYLEYDPVDVNGQILPAPQRQLPAPVEQGMMAQLQVIEHDIRTAMAMHQSAVGEGQPQQSGKAVLALQRQSDTGTFHFADNLATSIKYTGKQLVDLAPKVYEQKRVLKIIGEDGEERSVTVDPNIPQARDGDGVGAIYNVNVGKYDVAATVGVSYATKRQEQSDVLLEMVRSQPELMKVIGDLMFKAMDFPMSQEISKRLKMLLPPEIQQMEAQEIPPAIMQALEQIEKGKQEIQGKAEALSEAEREIDIKAVEVEKKVVDIFTREQVTEIKEAELDFREQQINAGKEDPARIQAAANIHIAEMKENTELLLALFDKQKNDEAIDRENQPEQDKVDIAKEMGERMLELKTHYEALLKAKDATLDIEPLTKVIEKFGKEISKFEKEPPKEDVDMTPVVQTLEGMREVLAQAAAPKIAIYDKNGKIIGSRPATKEELTKRTK